MKLLVPIAFAFFGGCASSANAQAAGNDRANAVPVPNTQTKYLISHNEGDQRFITSIERIGPCTLSGSPLRTAQIRIPYRRYKMRLRPGRSRWTDLASVYQIETKALTRAVRRNAKRFPEDFMFQLAAA